MGTSLKVQPFASLVDFVPDTCPRLLINNELAGQAETETALNPKMKDRLEKLKNLAKTDPHAAAQYKQLTMLLGIDQGFKFGNSDNVRDIFHQSDCDSGVIKFAELLGWKDELITLIDKGKKAHAQAQSKGKL